jgi:hypothetical protein
MKSLVRKSQLFFFYTLVNKNSNLIFVTNRIRFKHFVLAVFLPISILYSESAKQKFDFSFRKRSFIPFTSEDLDTKIQKLSGLFDSKKTSIVFIKLKYQGLGYFASSPSVVIDSLLDVFETYSSEYTMLFSLSEITMEGTTHYFEELSLDYCHFLVRSRNLSGFVSHKFLMLSNISGWNSRNRRI